MTTALYTRLLRLLPDQPVLTATVYALHGDGTATVTLLGGADLRVRNPLSAGVGSTVYVQGDAVIGDAPSLTPVLIEI